MDLKIKTPTWLLKTTTNLFCVKLENGDWKDYTNVGVCTQQEVSSAEVTPIPSIIFADFSLYGCLVGQVCMI